MARSVRLLREEAEDNLTKQVRVFNPDSKDFTYEYLDKLHIIRAMEIVTLGYTEAEYAIKHLVDFLIDRRNKNPLGDRTELIKEVRLQ